MPLLSTIEIAAGIGAVTVDPPHGVRTDPSEASGRKVKIHFFFRRISPASFCVRLPRWTTAFRASQFARESALANWFSFVWFGPRIEEVMAETRSIRVATRSFPNPQAATRGYIFFEGASFQHGRWKETMHLSSRS